MTTEAPQRTPLSQNRKDIWSLSMVLVATSLFAGGYGYTTTGNPFSFLTMPHNQSHALEIIEPPVDQPDWTVIEQRMESSNDTIGGTAIITRSWNTGTEQPTINDLQSMLHDAGYDDTSCYPARNLCESTIQTTTGEISTKISYHPIIEDDRVHHYEIAAISIK